MEYNSLFEPLLCIFLSLTLGLLIGCIATAYASSKELGAINKELNAKNKELKCWVDKWKDKYTNDEEVQ
tara:strand:+ start:372 stop:578 length:207 start_codon:yes stop_codon:yes gene_type:complete